MPTEFAAIVAIDWADQKHAWAMQIAAESKVETGTIDHTPEAIDVWAAELRMRFGGQSVAVALEQSRGSLVFMLTKYDHLVIFPVHPTVLVNYRKSFRPSGAKDDPSDARLLLDILMLHRDKLRRFNPRHAGNAHIAVSGRRTAEVRARKDPLFEPAYGASEDVLSLRCSTGSTRSGPTLLQNSWSAGRASKSSSAPGRRRSSGSSSITTAATPSGSRNGWSRFGRQFRQPRTLRWSHSSSAAIVAWAALLKQVLVAISAYDKQIDELARAHPDYALVKSFPGAGPAMAPRLIAAMGSQRERYQSADRNPTIQRHCSCGRQQRQAVLGPLALGMPEVPTPDLSRVGAPLYRTLRLGTRILRSSSEPKANVVIPQSARWHSNGSASCSAVGRTASPTTK